MSANVEGPLDHDAGSSLWGGNHREESLPDQARLVRGAVDPQIFSVAALLHNNIINPANGQPWHGRDLEPAARLAFEHGTASCQSWAIKESEPDDTRSLEHAELADRHADAAGDWIADTEKIRDRLAVGPDGAFLTRGEIDQRHRADNALAEERSAEGDTEHTQRHIPHAWFIVASVTLALLDVFLLWRPVLGLGFLGSSSMLFKWFVGVAFAVGQALFLERALYFYAAAERVSGDRRAALGDYNRRVRRGIARGLVWAAAEPAPDVAQLRAADRRLGFAHRLLVTAATFIAVVAGVRVAILARSSGLALVDSALFAGIVALILGGVVLLLGWLGQRGNQLGDRLIAGGRVVAETEAMIQDGRDNVARERETVQQELAEARAATARAADHRERITADFGQAVLLSWSWIGLDRSTVDHPRVPTRPLPVAERAETVRTMVEAKLAAIDRWLAGERAGVPADPLRPAIEAPDPGEPVLPPSLDPPAPGRPGAIVLAGCAVPAELAPPYRWIVVGATLAVVAAVLAALFAYTPASTGGVQFGSGSLPVHSGRFE